jgi:4-hydroxy-2-oxoheptanedioate aldolase
MCVLRSSALPNLRENRVKRKLERGEVATVASGLMTPDLVDMLGPMGFDGVWIETEHGPIDFADVPDLTRAADLWGMTSVVRVNQNVPGVIYRTFDVGAQGVVVPHVNSAAEARSVVDAGKFAPVGARGMYISRQGYGVSDFLTHANDETLLVVLIEDIVAVDNLSEILKVDHIDVFFVAPGDLAQSMGLIGQIGNPRVQETIDGALAQIVAAGRTAGALVSDASVESYLEKGARFLMVGWQAWVASGSRAFLDSVATARG